MINAKITNSILRFKVGGEGSGHYQHAGRIGRVGGSLPGNRLRQNPPAIEIQVLETMQDLDFNPISGTSEYDLIQHAMAADSLRRALRRMRGDRRDYYMEAGLSREEANARMLEDVRNAPEQALLREERDWLALHYQQAVTSRTDAVLSDIATPASSSAPESSTSETEGEWREGITSQEVIDQVRTADEAAVQRIIQDWQDSALVAPETSEQPTITEPPVPEPTPPPPPPDWDTMSPREQQAELQRIISNFHPEPNQPQTLGDVISEPPADFELEPEPDPGFPNRRATAEEVIAARRAVEANAVNSVINTETAAQTPPTTAAEGTYTATIVSAPEQYQNKMVEFMQDWSSIPQSIPMERGVPGSVILSVNGNPIHSIDPKYGFSAEDAQKMLYIPGMEVRVDVKPGNASLGMIAYVYDPQKSLEYSIGEVRYSFYGGRENYGEGEYTRTEFYANYMKFDQEYKNQGWGGTLATRSAMMAKVAGYRTMRFSADISIGKYSWAREGADFSSPSDLRKAKRGLNDFAAREIFHMPSWYGQEQRDEENPEYKKFRRATRKIKNAYELASFDWQGMRWKGSTTRNSDVLPDLDLHLGKRYMLDYNFNSWSARIDLQSLGGW